MLKTVVGFFKNGKVELLETIPDQKEGRVLVTFLPKSGFTLAEVGLTKEEAANLRWRLQAFAEDWDSPDMDVYNEL